GAIRYQRHLEGARMTRLSLCLTLGAMLAGCSGVIGEPDGIGSHPSSTTGGGPGGSTGTTGSTGAGGSTPNPPPPPPPPSAQVTCPATMAEIVGHRALRRLTNAELE